MANKRRAKKYKVPYKKYGPNGIISTKVSANEFKQQNSSFSSSSSYYRSRKDEDDDPFYTYSYGRLNQTDNQDYYGSERFTHKRPIIGEKDSYTTAKDQPMLLPAEIFEIILKQLAYPDGLNLKFFLVSKLFYQLCLKLLYCAPRLNSRNFNKFVDSMTNPSLVSYLNYQITEKYFIENFEKGATHSLSMKRNLKYSKTPLVRSLDLANIVQAGKNSNITKILRRCSPSLTEIVAPQTSFGLTSLSILKMCQNLVILDLSLVSETVNLIDLFNSIKGLDFLKVLKFPRSSINCNLESQVFDEIDSHEKAFQWPKNLQHLKISGGITNEFLMDLKFPKTLNTLEFQYCPLLNDYAIYYLLTKVGYNISSLSIIYPMPGLKENSLDLIFKYCPFLVNLDIFVDYISQWCFTDVNLPWIVNAKYLPDYKPDTHRENVLSRGGGIGNSWQRVPSKYKFDDDLPDDDSLKDLIISTTVNHFGDYDDEDIEMNDSFEQYSSKYEGLCSLRQLRSLYLGSSGTLGQANKIHPDDLIIALAESRLPNLKYLNISNRVGWNAGDEAMTQLIDLFSDLNDGSVYMCP